jgi:hypothetical protein
MFRENQFGQSIQIFVCMGNWLFIIKRGYPETIELLVRYDLLVVNGWAHYENLYIIINLKAIKRIITAKPTIILTIINSLISLRGALICECEMRLPTL